MQTGERYNGEARLAKGLGWFSVALGAAEMAAPARIASLTGIPPKNGARGTLRVFGAREMANGVAILASRPRSAWLWTRVAGDLIDLAALRSAMDEDGADRRKLGMAAASVGGVLAADIACAVQLARRAPDASETAAVRVSKTFTINREPDVVYAAWRELDTLPDVLRHLRSIESDTLEEIPNSRIAWRSSKRVAGERVHGAVHVRRAPGNRGTELRVEIAYTPLGGRAANAIARLLRAAPEQRIEEDLRRLKQLLETGEIARSAPGHARGDRARELAGQGGRS